MDVQDRIRIELAKISEAYCLANGIPVRRQFSDAELADTFDNLRESKKVAEAIEAQMRAAGMTP